MGCLFRPEIFGTQPPLLRPLPVQGEIHSDIGTDLFTGRGAASPLSIPNTTARRPYHSRGFAGGDRSLTQV